MRVAFDILKVELVIETTSVFFSETLRHTCACGVEDFHVCSSKSRAAHAPRVDVIRGPPRRQCSLRLHT